MEITFGKTAEVPTVYSKEEIIRMGGWWMTANKTWVIFIPRESYHYLYLSSDGTLTIDGISNLCHRDFIPCTYKEIKITL